jgi:hypothetical protein
MQSGRIENGVARPIESSGRSYQSSVYADLASVIIRRVQVDYRLWLSDHRCGVRYISLGVYCRYGDRRCLERPLLADSVEKVGLPKLPDH